MNPWLVLAIATAALGIVFGGLEFAVREPGAPTEPTRRISHVAACAYAIVIHEALPLLAFIAVALTFVAIMAASKVYRVLRSIHDTKRTTWGEVYMPLGLAVAAGIAGPDTRAFATSAAILGLADVAAGLVGDFLNSAAKTWAGSAAFAVVALALCLVARYGVLASVVTAVALTAVERLSPRGSDNLTIVAGSAVLLLALET